MYLSRLKLNPRSREVRRDLADFYQMHRTILRGFPETAHGVDFRKHHGVLYRVDIIPATGIPHILVQSITKPDWSFLEDIPGYLLFPESSGMPNPDFKIISEHYKNLKDGQELSFRLRANVTRKIETKTGTDGRRNHGRRVPLRTIEEQKDWLSRKAEKSGFQLLNVAVCDEVADLRITPERDIFSAKTAQDKSYDLTFGSVLFEGRLCITSSELFRRTLEDGLGATKAFGFGLVSIAAH